MKLKKIAIHNFRSIKEQEIELGDYSLLIGENNAGKSNVFRALRVFYELEKYNENMDFPKFTTDDEESWIELLFMTTDEEQESLKDEYKDPSNVLRVRKYLKSAIPGRMKPSQSNIYAYENGSLSNNLFYGARNISQSKLGNIIYVPEVSTVDDSLRTSGPSPLRNILNFVVKKLVEKSSSYTKLNSSFEDFNREFKVESRDGYSIREIEESINNEMNGWGVNFGLTINSIRPEDLVKNLVTHYFEDENLNNQRVSIDSFGQGLQRHLIYSLIKISAQYEDEPSTAKKDFSPDYTLILFEEPEAFLHPNQQQTLNLNLRRISGKDSPQILITTHSPIFVNKNIENLADLKVVKRDIESKFYQISKSEVDNLYDENLSLYQLFHSALSDPSVDESIKKKIKNNGLASQNDDSVNKIYEESFRYGLWLDSERSALFFARKVLIVEGPSEKVLLEVLLSNEWQDLFEKKIYILEAGGKYNIHRFMNLLGKFGIRHSLLLDKDNDADIHSLINKFINDNSNSFTDKIHWFDKDLENFLGVSLPARSDLKPLNIIKAYRSNIITAAKIAEFKNIISDLIQN